MATLIVTSRRVTNPLLVRFKNKLQIGTSVFNQPFLTTLVDVLLNDS